MAHFLSLPFIVKSRFFYYSQVGKRRKIGTPFNPFLRYLSDLALLALVAHDGVVGDALEGGELVQVIFF